MYNKSIYNIIGFFVLNLLHAWPMVSKHDFRIGSNSCGESHIPGKSIKIVCDVCVANITFVCVCVYEREVTESHSTATQTVLFLCKATAGCYIMEPTSTASKGTIFRLKEALYKAWYKN